jgi:hypothetical protein
VEAEPLATATLKTALAASHKLEFDSLRDEETKVSPSKRSESIFQLAAADDVDELELKSPLTTSESLFLKDEHWLCTNCGQR